MSVPVTLVSGSLFLEDVLPDVSVPRDFSGGASPPDLFFACTGNLGSTREDQEGEYEDGGLA